MVEIRLTQGQTAFIDDWNYERVSQYQWHAHKAITTGKFYARAYINGQHVYLHNFLLPPPQGMEIDHIDHNGLNCCEDNMRFVTHAQNQKNQSKQRSNTSGYIGVSHHILNKRYQAYIESDGKQHYLGYFDNPIDAARRRDVAATELHGEFANLNFPDEWEWDTAESKWHRKGEA